MSCFDCRNHQQYTIQLTVYLKLIQVFNSFGHRRQKTKHSATVVQKENYSVRNENEIRKTMISDLYTENHHS